MGDKITRVSLLACFKGSFTLRSRRLDLPKLQSEILGVFNDLGKCLQKLCQITTVDDSVVCCHIDLPPAHCKLELTPDSSQQYKKNCSFFRAITQLQLKLQNKQTPKTTTSPPIVCKLKTLCCIRIWSSSSRQWCDSSWVHKIYLHPVLDTKQTFPSCHHSRCRSTHCHNRSLDRSGKSVWASTSTDCDARIF